MLSVRVFAVMAAALGVSLAACENPETAVHYAPKQARADRAAALHGVSFSPLRDDLSASERQRLMAFVRELPTDRATVVLFTASDSPSLQAQRAAAVRSQLEAWGVPVATVARAQGFAVGPDTVVVSAESYSARALNCPDFSKSAGYDPLNLPQSNLGCATARNLADMVADPRDLERGRSPGPASGHLGASAVDRLYNGKVKDPAATQLGIGASGGSSSGGAGN
ncbi:CpaD family pilus assembly lipoprotein [Reyranella sp. CPCC 100927]|uniref:CpaD family pilus assembly lipoprotein n=1 Tax=Reyranella sp. CPCC 100927 TaxID=2599616 RepID=UPI0011B6088C|nr:CpaD family pilus assembly lipoprotein [Reyranella sp. CPCC 100927]TWT10215.1 hypothetical protein FQU96_19215 [Reyranella sp. CPCC 100927]